jgi:hypothetical protein
MKKILRWAILLVFITPQYIYSQTLDSLTLSQMKLNFIVPDMPAFKSLGTEPSNLLRPSTPQAFAVAISEFYSQQKFIIPNSFAIEISPSLLLNAKKGKHTLLNDYAPNRVLNSFRISLGSGRDTSFSPSGRNLALGFRINLINDGEMATDIEELQLISAKLAEFRIATRTTRKAFATENLKQIKIWAKAAHNQPDSVIDKAKQLDAILDWDFLLHEKLSDSDSTWRKKYEEFVSQFPTPEFDTWFAVEKVRYKKENWNANKLDLALSILGSSKDSLLGSAKFSRIDLWGTFALKSGDNGQALFGFNAGYGRIDSLLKVNDDKKYLHVSIPVRYLMGTNRIKGFCEIQYEYLQQNKSNNGLFNLGAEVNPLDGLWLNFYGGINFNATAGSSYFRTNLDIKITLPEKFSFF